VALQDHPKVKQDIDESLIEPWLEVVAKTYFEQCLIYSPIPVMLI